MAVIVSSRLGRKRVSRTTTAAATDKQTTIMTNGIDAGDVGNRFELISPTPSPAATSTKIARKMIRATLGMDMNPIKLRGRSPTVEVGSIRGTSYQTTALRPSGGEWLAGWRDGLRRARLLSQRDFGHDPDEENQDRRDEQNAKNGQRHR